MTREHLDSRMLSKATKDPLPRLWGCVSSVTSWFLTSEFQSTEKIIHGVFKPSSFWQFPSLALGTW
jgi:hypothetical protein